MSWELDPTGRTQTAGAEAGAGTARSAPGAEGEKTERTKGKRKKVRRRQKTRSQRKTATKQLRSSQGTRRRLQKRSHERVIVMSPEKIGIVGKTAVIAGEALTVIMIVETATGGVVSAEATTVALEGVVIVVTIGIAVVAIVTMNRGSVETAVAAATGILIEVFVGRPVMNGISCHDGCVE